MEEISFSDHVDLITCASVIEYAVDGSAKIHLENNEVRPLEPRTAIGILAAALILRMCEFWLEIREESHATLTISPGVVCEKLVIPNEITLEIATVVFLVEQLRKINQLAVEHKIGEFSATNCMLPIPILDAKNTLRAIRFCKHSMRASQN